MRLGRIALIAVCAVLPMLAMGRAHSAEPLKIRIGWVVVPASLQPILFAKHGLAKHLGTSYVMEPVHFAGTSPEITALAAGELDIGSLAFSSFGLAIQNAHLDDLRIIADEVQDGVDGYYSNEFMVRKDGPIKTVADLKGKVLATNAIGTAVDLAMRAMLRRHHLEDQRDYSVVQVSFPNMKAMLQERKADLIVAVPPFSYDPGLRAIGRTLFRQKDAFGATQLTAWVARASFLQKNRAAIVDFLEDVLRAKRWYEDPANHDEVVKVIAQFTKQPPERFAGWVFTKKDDYRDPNGLPNLDALQRNLDTEKDLGFLKTTIDVKKYTDLSLVETAAKRLK
jgi:NitT/TauT family transport system substrate-binding protein